MLPLSLPVFIVLLCSSSNTSAILHLEVSFPPSFCVHKELLLSLLIKKINKTIIRRLRGENHKFKASLGYIASLRPDWARE
jgi:hypothetical protein